MFNENYINIENSDLSEELKSDDDDEDDDENDNDEDDDNIIDEDEDADEDAVDHENYSKSSNNEKDLVN